MTTEVGVSLPLQVYKTVRVKSVFNMVKPSLVLDWRTHQLIFKNKTYSYFKHWLWDFSSLQCGLHVLLLVSIRNWIKPGPVCKPHTVTWWFFRVTRCQITIYLAMSFILSYLISWWFHRFLVMFIIKSSMLDFKMCM